MKIFFRYKLDISKDINDNMDIFTKLIQDIKQTGDKNIDVKSAIKYGRDKVTLDTVINGLKSKEFDLKTNKGNKSLGEVNFVRGRPQNRFQK